MAKTEVILTSNIVGLGGESDQVKVAAGYARNYLYPQGLAIPVTQANKRRLESLRQRRAEREAHEFNTMSELSKGVAKLICVISVKTGEDGKMFGTVTSGMITDQLKHQFDITLEKRKIHLEHPIRALGDHEVELHLHADVKAVLKVRVESTTPLPAALAAPAEANRDREGRPERRGYRGEGHKAGQPAAGAEQRPSAVRAEGGTKPEREPRKPKVEKLPRQPKPEKQDKPQAE